MLQFSHSIKTHESAEAMSEMAKRWLNETMEEKPWGSLDLGFAKTERRDGRRRAELSYPRL